MDPVERAAAEWLAADPIEAVPDDLLARVMSDVRGARQRSAVLARVLGASGGSAPAHRRAELAFVVMLLAVAVISSVALFVGGRPSDLPVIPVPPSASPASIAPSIGPAASPSASVTSTPSSTSPASPEGDAPVAYPDLGFVARPFAGGSVIRDGAAVVFETAPEATLGGFTTDRVIVNVGSIASGATVDLGPLPVTAIHGATVSAVVTNLRTAMPGAAITTTPVTVDAIRGVTATLATPDGSVVVLDILIRGDRLDIIRGDAHLVPTGQTIDVADARLLADFGPKLHFLDPSTVVTPAFLVRPPAGWHGRGFGSPRLPISRSSGSALSGYQFDVWSTSPGSTTSIPVGDENQGQRPLDVSGTDLDSLAASVGAGIPTATRTSIVVGGEPAYRFDHVEQAIVGPIDAIAVVWHAGDGYIFVEHSVLDGPPSGEFDAVLAGITFL